MDMKKYEERLDTLQELLFDVAESIAEIKDEIEEKEDKGDYTVGHFSNVTFDEDLSNLVFGNGARVSSLYDGAGVGICEDYVDCIYITEHGEIEVLLKGNRRLDTIRDLADSKVIYGGKNED